LEILDKLLKKSVLGLKMVPEPANGVISNWFRFPTDECLSL